MIIGVGTDILSIKRLSGVLDSDSGFAQSVYTPDELAIIRERPEPVYCYATRFAGKEAVFKALRLDGNTRWHQIEILSEPDGSPRVRLNGAAARHAASLGITKVAISLSYEEEYACAFAVASTD